MELPYSGSPNIVFLQMYRILPNQSFDNCRKYHYAVGLETRYARN